VPLSIDFSISCRRVVPAVFFFLDFCVLSLIELSLIAPSLVELSAAAGALAEGGLAGGEVADCAAGAAAVAGDGAAGAGAAALGGVVAGAAAPAESGAFCASAKPWDVQTRIAAVASETRVRIENSQFFIAQNREGIAHLKYDGYDRRAAAWPAAGIRIMIP
jgi:hypothetical protein